MIDVLREKDMRSRWGRGCVNRLLPRVFDPGLLYTYPLGT